MANVRLPRELEYVGMSNQVGLDIGGGIIDRMADAGLCPEMDDRVDAMMVGNPSYRFAIGQIHLDEGELLAIRHQQRLQPVMFQLGGVIAIQIVEADDAISPCKQRAARMGANEACCSGYQGRHIRFFRAGKMCIFPKPAYPYPNALPRQTLCGKIWRLFPLVSGRTPVIRLTCPIYRFSAESGHADRPYRWLLSHPKPPNPAQIPAWPRQAYRR